MGVDKNQFQQLSAKIASEYRSSFFNDERYKRYALPPFIIGTIGFSIYALLACVTLSFLPIYISLPLGIAMALVEGACRGVDIYGIFFDIEKENKDKSLAQKGLDWYHYKNWFKALRGFFLIATIVTFTMRYQTLLVALFPVLPAVITYSIGIIFSTVMAISLLIYTEHLFNRLTYGRYKNNGIVNENYEARERDERAAGNRVFKAHSINYALLIGLSVLHVAGVSLFSIIAAVTIGTAFYVVSYLNLKAGVEHPAKDVPALEIAPKLQTSGTRWFYIGSMFCITLASAVAFNGLYVGYQVFAPYVAAWISPVLLQAFAIGFSLCIAFTLFYLSAMAAERVWMYRASKAYNEVHAAAEQGEIQLVETAPNWFKVVAESKVAQQAKVASVTAPLYQHREMQPTNKPKLPPKPTGSAKKVVANKLLTALSLLQAGNTEPKQNAESKFRRDGSITATKAKL